MKLPLKVVLAIGGAVVLAALAVWYFSRTTVEVTHPRTGPVVDAVYATGTVEPVVMIPVAPRTGGRVTAVLAHEGDHVAPGQILARLESADLQASVAQLRAQEANARLTFQRDQKLLPVGGIARSAYDAAQTALKAATEARKQAEAQLDYMQLVSPVSATVISRDGEVGQLIPAGQAMYWLAEKGPLRITTQVDEEDIPRVKTGQDVLIRTDAFPGRTFNGTVSSVTPKGDSVARSFRVRIALDKDTPLRIGMTVETNIILAKRADALLVPSGSLVNTNYVWQVAGGRLRLQPVTIGVAGISETEVGTGLASTSLVVVHPAETLEQGQSVRTRLTGEN